MWLNPPFNRYEAGAWVERLAVHGNGILLLHAASAILFLPNRIKFCRQDGDEHPANSGAPVLLAAFGESNAVHLRQKISGVFVTAWEILPQWRVRCDGAG